MTESVDEAMRDRLTRLERTMRRWRRMGAGVLAALGCNDPRRGRRTHGPEDG